MKITIRYPGLKKLLREMEARIMALLDDIQTQLGIANQKLTLANEKADAITQDIVRLNQTIANLQGGATPDQMAALLVQATELANLASANADRLTDIDAATPEV